MVRADELDAILDGVDEGLARQLRDLKTFIGGAAVCQQPITKALPMERPM